MPRPQHPANAVQTKNPSAPGNRTDAAPDQGGAEMAASRPSGQRGEAGSARGLSVRRSPAAAEAGPAAKAVAVPVRVRGLQVAAVRAAAIRAVWVLPAAEVSRATVLATAAAAVMVRLAAATAQLAGAPAREATAAAPGVAARTTAPVAAEAAARTVARAISLPPTTTEVAAEVASQSRPAVRRRWIEAPPAPAVREPFPARSVLAAALPRRPC